MSSDEIDVDSWGKKPEPTPSPERHPNVTRTSPDDPTPGDEEPERHPKPQRKQQRPNREILISRSTSIPALVPKTLTQKALLEFMIGLDYPLEGKDYFIAWLTRTYTRKGRSRKSTGKARTIVLDFLKEVYQQLKKEGFE
jgi:hypothetical protein